MKEKGTIDEWGVAKVKGGENKGKDYWWFKSGDKKYNVFTIPVPEGIMNGAEIEFEFTMKGEWPDVTEVKIIPNEDQTTLAEVKREATVIESTKLDRFKALELTRVDWPADKRIEEAKKLLAWGVNGE